MNDFYDFLGYLGQGLSDGLQSRGISVDVFVDVKEDHAIPYISIWYSGMNPNFTLSTTKAEWSLTIAIVFSHDNEEAFTRFIDPRNENGIGAILNGIDYEEYGTLNLRQLTFIPQEYDSKSPVIGVIEADVWMNAV